MKITFLKSLLVLGAFLCFGYIQAQEVSGTVSDASGPLPGASVLEKGTTNGTQTDFDGNYTLTAEEGAVLIVSYIGYKTQEVAINGRTSINFTLEEDAEALEEVVIIGYGTTTVKDATGSVSSVSSEDFNGGIIASPEQLIQGKTAGVQISQSSGEPGAGISLRIRGTGSVRGNNSPLFVIDGVPVSNDNVSATGTDVGGQGTSGAKNPLNFLNPNDIESMSILKDASATAIYGSRGANGVVVITTKSGKGGGKEGQWNFSSNLNIATVANPLDLLSADEFVARGGADLGGSTDWQEYIFRTTASTDNNLAYSQNYGSGNIRATFGYSKQFGIIENTDLERITGRINVNQRFLNDKLKLGVQATISRINDRAPLITRQAGSIGDLLASAYYSNPTRPANSSSDASPDLNPANLLSFYDDNTNTNRFLGNLSLEYDFTDELSAKINLGLDTSESQRNQVVSPGILGLQNGTPGNGRASLAELNAESKLMEITVNYNKEFENSKLDALVGYSYQDFNRNGADVAGFGFATRDLRGIADALGEGYNNTKNLASNYQGYGVGPFQDLGADAGNQFRILGLSPNVNTTTASSIPNIPLQALSVNTFDNTDELQSFFGRLNYSIADKYLFTGTVRADGSSRFGGNNQYGVFPSAAFAWKMNQEEFINEDVFSTFKLRVSYGITGNQDGLGYGQFVNRTRWDALGINANGDLSAPATSEVAFANADLKWEETTQYGLGLDLGFNNDRFTASIDVYRKETNDILLNLPAVQPATVPFVFQNVDGTIINQGVELGVDYDLVQSDDLNWNLNFNVSYNQNELTNYAGPDLQAGQLYGPGLSDAFSQILTNGQPIFTYNLRNVDENFQVATDPTIQDKSALPTIVSGLSTSLNYKNWDASLFFSGQFGMYVYNNTNNALFATPQIGSRNNLSSVLDDNIILSSQNPNTYFLEKGDFVRLQTASISYNVPLSGDGLFKTMRLSAVGQNLFLLTGYSGLDPEVSSSNLTAGGLPSAGIDYLSYPRPVTVSLGFNVTF